ncbi:MAG TPA: signal peptidase II [Ignavibacteriaceae bacterium]|nr:signal peptidase II [Ignavibacteriaceae bacterium]
MKVIYITLSIILLDQFSKFYIRGIKIPFLNLNLDGMYLGESINVIGEFFKITYIENPGMAFGFNPGSDYKLLISLFSLAASIGLIVYLFVVKKKTLSLRIAIALILGGAVGNLVDRMFYGVLFDYAPLFYGKVVDFFDFDFFNFSLLGRSYDRWPIFNIADASVTIGVLILILFYKQHNSEDDNKAAEVKISSGETISVEDHASVVPQDEEYEPGQRNVVNNDNPDKGKEI